MKFATELSTPEHEWDPDSGECLSPGSIGLARNPSEIVGDRLYIDYLLDGLKPLQAQVIRLVYLDGLSQTEAARALGISNNYVSYICKHGHDKMKKRHALDELREAV